MQTQPGRLNMLYHATCTFRLIICVVRLCATHTSGLCSILNLNLATRMETGKALSPASSQNFVFFGPLGALLGKPGEKILPYLMGAALPLRQGRFPRLQRLHQNRNAAA